MAKVSPIARLYLRLINAGNFVFDRILDRENLARRRIEDREHGRQRRRLAAARGPGDHDHAMRQIKKASHLFFVARRETQFGNVEKTAIARQEADDCGFAMLRGHGGDADVEIGPRRLQSRGAILGETAFRDVESGKNLDARDERLRQNLRRRGDRRAIDHPPACAR